MGNEENIQPLLSQKARGVLQGLSPTEREALLIRCWMSHDARWFMVVAREYGMQAANRLNQMAAHEIGKVEAQRMARKLKLPPVNDVDGYLSAQEVFIGLLGPTLIERQVHKIGENGYRIDVQRCFAHENVVQAGIAEQYECGIFARVTGWLEALGLNYEMRPALGKCLKVEGKECTYRFTLK